MKFSCEIEKHWSVKKGMKMTLYIAKDNAQEVLKNLYNFLDKPLTVDLLIDADLRRVQMAMITQDQRSKIYAILKDIAEYVGDSKDSIKLEMKQQFCADKQQEDFSLANCSKELSVEFIEWLIVWCFEHGVALTDHPKEAFEDIEDYLKLCLKKKICCICGEPGEEHHWDAIGMGRNRKTYDDSDHRKCCLCRKHHSEVEQIGRDTFASKYHVKGVLVS